ncbi:MAG: ThuA domain-containing protein, partial [Planctomycetales bacterium]
MTDPPWTNAEDEKQPVRVVVWDEQQPEQRETYGCFLGEALAEHLSNQPGLLVKSARLADPEGGLGQETLDENEVMIWWGHRKHLRVSTKQGQAIVERIKSGRLSLIALHSAHWSVPFVEAMRERTRQDARQRFPETNDRSVKFDFVPPPSRFTVPARGSAVTPIYHAYRQSRDAIRVRVDMPGCCFPDYRVDGQPSAITVLKRDHPIAAGLPKTFKIAQSEMYSEPFHVPDPDEVILKESWESGDWFR